MYEEQDTELAQRRKHHCSQECVGKIKNLNLNSSLKSNLGRTYLKIQIQKCKLTMTRIQIAKRTHIDHNF